MQLYLCLTISSQESCLVYTEKPFRFLNLPPEIRLFIYGISFLEDRHGKPINIFPQLVHPSSTRDININLLRTCKRIYHEALPTFRRLPFTLFLLNFSLISSAHLSNRAFIALISTALFARRLLGLRGSDDKESPEGMRACSRRFGWIGAYSAPGEETVGGS